MRIRGWGWVLPALIGLGGGWGCASTSNDSAVGGGFHGGQTGSLRPCSTPAFGSSASVPTGDAALVFHTGCATDADFKITDQNGELVPFELEALGDGVVLLQTEEALTPGTYEVQTPDGQQQTVTVTDPAPLPTQLGTLIHTPQRCRPLFELGFDDTIAPYLPFLRLEYSVDDGPKQTWFEYGTLASSQGSAWLELGPLTRGDHRLEVFGTIAGEEMQPGSERVSFPYTPCAGDDATDDGLAPCTLGRGGAGAAAGDGPLTLVLIGAAFALGRRRRLTLTPRR